ncbi:MAG: methyltransferase domain-containing protein [Candidatus Eremiobacteraeota bacterium]|nr:methyltransferase domain-containing protein [Candidatus Eremiobacteraeota bacterium]
MNYRIYHTIRCFFIAILILSAGIFTACKDRSRITAVPKTKYVLEGDRQVTVPLLELKIKKTAGEVINWERYSDEAFSELFNRREKKPLHRGVENSILDLLDLNKGQYIADVGCGLGYYVFAFSEKVGTEGRVYATDLDPNSKAFIEWRIKLKKSGFYELAGYDIKESAYDNIICGVNTHTDVNLPPNTFDWLFLNQVHYFTGKEQDMEKATTFTDSLIKALKPGGKILISEWDYLREGKSEKEYIAMDEIAGRLEQMGLKITKRIDEDRKETDYQDFPIPNRTIFILEPK